MAKKLTVEQKAEQKKKRLAYAKQYYLANRDKLIKYAVKNNHIKQNERTNLKASSIKIFSRV